MRTNFSKANWPVARPIRAFASGFAATALLFCVATPFMDDLPNRWLFLLGGFGYSAFLSFFAVGIGLLPSRIRRRVLSSLIPLHLLCVASSLSIFLLARSGNLATISAILTPSLWALSIVGAALLVSAFYGWYSRFTDDANNDA